MAERDWWIVAVRLSDSFRGTIGDLAAELGAGLVEWTPDTGEALPSGATALLLLAGGSESAALDLLPALPLPSVPRYVVGASPDHRLAAAALQRGARDYFSLPDDLELLRRSLEREARESRGRLAAERFATDERRLSGFEAMVGRSATLRRTIEQAARVASHRDVTVLVGGETGTGKELLARAVHYHSPRAAAPFVEINCAAIPANLLESELFGHERGAFTGALAAKLGLFELAHGGTVFLDEVGHLPLELQPKLLRALESREIRRVGGQETRHIDVRVIGATHVNLAEAVAGGKFREDLFYRLNVVALTLPPLRDRDGDVELLAETFLTRLATSYGLPVPPLSPEVRAALRNHPWPGNVRELRNAIERALVLSPPGTLQVDELRMPQAEASDREGVLPFPARLDVITRAAVQATLQLVGGNKSEAARRLGISRPRLQRILDGQTDE
ncbi:MAG: sigma-54 interaction domain-containing protein [Gemmatimonadales bacterium]